MRKAGTNKRGINDIEMFGDVRFILHTTCCDVLTNLRNPTGATISMNTVQYTYILYKNIFRFATEKKVLMSCVGTSNWRSSWLSQGQYERRTESIMSWNEWYIQHA